MDPMYIRKDMFCEFMGILMRIIGVIKNMLKCYYDVVFAVIQLLKMLI